jgi:hypothetical protein
MPAMMSSKSNKQEYSAARKIAATAWLKDPALHEQ